MSNRDGGDSQGMEKSETGVIVSQLHEGLMKPLN